MKKGFIAAKIKYTDKDAYHCVDGEGKTRMLSSLEMLSALLKGRYVGGFVCGQGTKAYVRLASGIPVIERHRKFSIKDYHRFVYQYLARPETGDLVLRSRKIAEKYVAGNGPKGVKGKPVNNGKVSSKDLARIGRDEVLKFLRKYSTGGEGLDIGPNDVERRSGYVWDLVKKVWNAAYAVRGHLRRTPGKCIYFWLDSYDSENDWAICCAYTNFSYCGMGDGFYFVLAHQGVNSASVIRLNEDWELATYDDGNGGLYGVAPMFDGEDGIPNIKGVIEIFKYWEGIQAENGQKWRGVNREEYCDLECADEDFWQSEDD